MPRRDLRTRTDSNLKGIGPRLAQKRSQGKADAPDPCKDAFDECRNHPAVRKACEFAEVDHSDPGVLAALLIAFASARFGKKKRGQDEKWDSLKLSLLLNWYFRLRKKNTAKTSDKDIFKQLVKMRYFQNDTPATLRRRLVDAADKNKNLLLKHVLANWQETLGVAPRRRRRSFPDWETLPDRADESKYKFHRLEMT
jgi:hypothetical protein